MEKRIPLAVFDAAKSFSCMEETGFFINHEKVPFDPKEDHFSSTNAWWMADCARISYMTDKKLAKKYLRDAGFTRVKYFNKDTSQAFVAYNNEFIVVAFTGTEIDKGFSDIVTDLDFLPSRAKTDGFVHRGFEKAIDIFWDSILTFITPLTQTRRLWYTGHSLGGALATLAAAYYPGQGVYTFGSPRVGSRDFVDAIKTPVYRVAKSNDIVTRIPTPPIYRHAGNLYFINSDGTLRKNPLSLTMFKERLGGNEMAIAWQLIKVIVFNSPMSFLLKYLHDHSPYNYSVYMWNNIGEYEEEIFKPVEPGPEYYYWSGI